MSEQKLVSIIMPIYNAEKYLRVNLEAIADQTHTNLEVLLIDDGSTDLSAVIAQKFCEKDVRFRYFIQKNQGAPSARNYGFRESQGKYALFVDSDDILKTNAVELLYLVAEKQEADLVIGQYDTINEKGAPLETKKMQYTKDQIYKVDENIYTLFLLSPMPGNKLYNANLLREKDLFFSNLKRAQDLNFYLKFLLYADKVCTLSDTTYLYRIRVNSISHTVSPVILETIRSVEDVEEFYHLNRRYDERLFKTLKFKYYADQLAKIPQIEGKKERKYTYDCLAMELKAIERGSILERFQSKRYSIVKTKLMFPLLFKSELYSWLQTAKLNRRDRINCRSHE
ncbi:MAG: glycosyltransferase [Alkalibacterium sp.]|nr:glycosyltransferase [Alkalibacterium sp.]MDN6290522.1 glycosyltransferase [Tetragenococcus koreensis]MDN6730458.1 glycosyltransferase [Alkalibacterium sp.]